ncbi:MFS transporter [Leucobacter sp. M11]|uniref:MFS transporter n=1 Tax=Leucobacter sp. M11 TaxID=2993565 RepID=UPI002D7EA932|nr:MFS transporter [Leucobacter sp. M11]
MTARNSTSARAWRMLAIGTAAHTASTVFVAAPAFLIPLLHSERGLSLAQAGLLAAAPTLGLVLTLIAWGALVDRLGERWAMTAGLTLTALAAGAAVLAPGYGTLGLFLVLGGMAAGSTNSATGRVVVGWFPPDRRGLAMGVRQMSQPLGTTVAALTIPGLAASFGIGAALMLPAISCAVFAVACWLGIENPPRPAARPARASGAVPAASGNPYRGSWFLWRIHAVSVLLVIPQYTLSTFGLVWLISGRGWPDLAAGVLVGAAQFLGALGRIAVGHLSDRLGSRVRPIRWVSVAAGAAMLALGGADWADWGAAAAVLLLVATTISVADNGLAFTSVAEVAGPGWSGRALGVQNTGQFIAAAAVGPVVGLLIGALGYPLAFALTALAPAAALPLIPADAEERRLRAR